MPTTDASWKKLFPRRVTRRQALSAAAVGGLGVVAAPRLTNASGGRGTRTRQANESRIIDFRARPPIPEYTTFFTDQATASVNERLGAEAVARSFREKSVDLFFEEMAEAGVAHAVTNGRHTPTTHVSDERLADLQRQYPGKFLALAGTDLTQPMELILTGIDRAIGELGLRGVTVEPGLTAQARYADDRHLYPIYEKCVALGVPVLLMSGPYAGPDLSYTDPVHFDHVASAFPGLNIVLGHGCFPYVTQVIGLCFKHRNVYCSPDAYLFAPGRDPYVEAINLYSDQFLFGSAYPFRPIPQTVREAKELPIEPQALEKFLFRNAARLLHVG